MTATDPEVVLEPATLVLDGEQQRLRYSFRSLKQLEDHFGCLLDAIESLHRILSLSVEGLTGAVLGDLAVLVAAGIDGADPGTILDRLDGDNRRVTVTTAALACLDAWLEAFPARNVEAEAEVTSG